MSPGSTSFDVATPGGGDSPSPGGNLTARQPVGSILANQLDEEKAADNYQLPVEAIREAFAYVERNKELLETEAEIERLMLKRGDVARGPQSVS